MGPLTVSSVQSRLLWNEHCNWIGKPCNIFQANFNFVIVTDIQKFNEFKPSKEQSDYVLVGELRGANYNPVETAKIQKLK